MLWAVFYRASSRDGWAGPGGPRQLTAELASREVIARLPHAGQCPAPGLQRCTPSAAAHMQRRRLWVAHRLHMKVL